MTRNRTVTIKKSDLSRLLILHHHGGMYCDTDTIPIKRIDKFLELFDEYDAIHSWESESDMSFLLPPILSGLNCMFAIVNIVGISG